MIKAKALVSPPSSQKIRAEYSNTSVFK